MDGHSHTFAGHGEGVAVCFVWDDGENFLPLSPTFFLYGKNLEPAVAMYRQNWMVFSKVKLAGSPKLLHTPEILLYT